MRSRQQLAGIALVLLPVLAALGCVDTEALPVANGTLTVHVVMEPVGGAREAPKPPFLYGRGMVASVLLTPLDPEVQELWGKYGIQYLGEVQEADMLSATGTDLVSVVIPKGTYRVESVAFNNFDWNVFPTDPLLDPGKGKCNTTTGIVESVSFAIIEFDTSLSFAPDGDLFVTVPEDGGGSFTMVIDGAALTAAIDERVSCLLLSSNPDVYSREAVLSGTLYPADVAEFVSFQ